MRRFFQLAVVSSTLVAMSNTFAQSIESNRADKPKLLVLGTGW